MKQNVLRTYQRRSVTRKSGYHTCNETTGGECIILNSQKLTIFNKKADSFSIESAF